MIICENCGKPVSEEANHCGHCGAKLERDNQKTMLGLSIEEQQAFQNSIASAREKWSQESDVGESQSVDDILDQDSPNVDSPNVKPLENKDDSLTSLPQNSSEKDIATARTEIMQSPDWLAQDKARSAERNTELKDDAAHSHTSDGESQNIEIDPGLFTQHDDDPNDFRHSDDGKYENDGASENDNDRFEIHENHTHSMKAGKFAPEFSDENEWAIDVPALPMKARPTNRSGVPTGLIVAAVVVVVLIILVMVL